MACNGLAMGSFQLFGHPKWSPVNFGKRHILPILDPLFVPKHPIFKAFWGFRRAKTGHHDVQTRQKPLLWHSTWSLIIFEKGRFLFCTWRTLLIHFGTHLFGLPMGVKDDHTKYELEAQR